MAIEYTAGFTGYGVQPDLGHYISGLLVSLQYKGDSQTLLASFQTSCSYTIAHNWLFQHHPPKNIDILKPYRRKSKSIQWIIPEWWLNLEWSIGANGTETDLQRLGETLRFPMLIRALVEVAHKWDAFPQRTRADRKQMILGYLR